MVPDIIRDSLFGHLVRLATGNKYFQYPEERDPNLWKKYVNEEKSGNLARYGEISAPDNNDNDNNDNNDNDSQEESRNIRGVRTREHSSGSDTLPGDGDNYNSASGRKIDPEKGQDKHLIDWYGDDDPDNPRNWSRGKRFFVTGEIVLLTFSVYMGSAIFTAGIEDVMKDFGVSRVAATLGLTLYVAGYGLGPMIWAPLSEVPQIGRNPVYIATLLVFVLFQIPTALPANFGMLLAFRFLTGLFGSPALATGGATIGDLYRPQKQSYGMGVWGMGAVLGPSLAPLIGGFAAQAEGWTWTIWELMWISGFCLVFLFFFFPETSSPNILYRRTRRLRKLTGDDRLTCEPEIQSANMTGKDIALMVLVKPITLNFTEPMVFLLNLYIALIYGLLYCWFESFPIVFIQIYGFNLGEEGLAFLGILVGAFIAAAGLFTWSYYYQEKDFDENGNLQPELRLLPAMVGGFFVPICLFWFGWSARPSIHWIMPIIGSGFFSIAAFLLFQAVLPYLADAYPADTASVFAGNDLMRSSFGAGFPLFATAMYNTLGVGWASSLLGFLGIAFIPIPFILYKFGPRLRKMSKHARKD